MLILFHNCDAMKAARGKSYSMRSLERSSLLTDSRTNPLAASTSSATTSLTSEITKDGRIKKLCESCRMREYQHETLEARQVAIDLNALASGTNVEHISPSRDGIYARLARLMLQYGASAAIGSAAGFATLEILNKSSLTTTTTTEKIVASVSTSSDEITDFL